jgi:3-hydroxyisobutyrate dehydrogenase-like beta-hydroxyacid dehydrogenase
MAAGFTRIALIGFGEVGQTLGADLLACGTSVTAYDPLFAEPDSVPARALVKIRVKAEKTASDAIKNAELVISAVTAASDLDAARSVVPGLPRGAFYLDVNSVSPGMKQACSKIIDEVGGRYVEAAVMTPIAPKRIASAMLLGGPHAADFIARAQPLGFSGAKVFSHIVGQASATKMCRSVIIKGTEALLLESLVAARHYGVEKTVLDSLSDLMPVGDWEKLARYMISRALEHGTRRAEEMRESAKTVAEAGLAPLMTTATAEREDWAAAKKEALAHMDDLGALLDAIGRTMAGGCASYPQSRRINPGGLA